MDDWKERSVIKMITGAPGQGKTEMFYDEFGRLVDAQGIPVFGEQGLASYIDPEAYSVSTVDDPAFKAKQGSFIKNIMNKPVDKVKSGVQSPWVTLGPEKEIYNYGGPGIVKNRILSPQEADLLRRQFGN